MWVAGAPARLARRRRLCPSLFRARASARQSLAPRQQRRARQGQATYTVLGNMVSVDDMPVWVKDMEFLTEPLEGNKASFILKNSQRLRSYFQGRPGKIGQLFAIHDRHPPDTALDPQSGVLYFIRTEEGLQVLRCVSSLHALLALCQRLSGPAGCLGFLSSASSLRMPRACAGVGLIVAFACCVTDWRLRFAGPYRTNPFL